MLPSHPSRLAGGASLTPIVSTLALTLRRRGRSKQSRRAMAMSPCQNQSLRIESLEMDDGAHERVLSEVLGFGGSEQTPTETDDRPMTAEPQHLSPGAPLGAARVRCQRGSR
jgi:hypothetical protein